MSNIASPRRTSPGAFSEAEAFPASRVATVIAALILTIIMISFRPFQPATSQAVVEGGGDIVNQLGFGGLGALSIISMLALVDKRVLLAVLSPAWLLLIACVFGSAAHAIDPPTAMRSVVFTLIGLICVTAVLTLPRDADSFSRVIVFAAAAAVGLSYAGVIALPSIAIHGADEYEPQHAGFWRGVFTHKNIAGPVMACFSFMGIYLWRRGWSGWGLLIFASAMIFLANTGSKTTAGLVPLAILLVILPGVVGMRFLVPVFFALAIIGTALGTLGIVFIDPLKQLAEAYFPGLDYTGRTFLWAFSGEMIMKKPWFGYGYGSFWLTPIVTQLDQTFDQAWDIRGIVHGHNGYMDIGVYMGLPAMAMAVIAFIVVPIRDYLRVPPLKENVYLADMFMMMATFTLLNAFLESFFFRRVDPVWLFFVMSAFGLRLVARFAVPSSRPG